MLGRASLLYSIWGKQRWEGVKGRSEGERMETKGFEQILRTDNVGLGQHER